MSDQAPGAFETDIAVVGMAGRFAGARNLDEYWRNLRDGVESIITLSDDELLAAGVDAATLRDPHYVKAAAVLPDMQMFDAPFFGFSPREAAIMDPQHRHFLECAWEALEDAGHVPERFQGAIGVFGGSGHNAYMPYNLLSNPKLVSSVGHFLLRHTGNDKDFLTTRVSYLLNLKGPSVNVQTACSTSLVAIHIGCQSLLNGECDMALAGGVTIELPHGRGYRYEEGEILSPDGHCHAFDADSKGTVFGSGAGIVVLRRLADALADGDHIHAVIKGSAVNNDGAMKVGYLAPSVDGQAQVVAEALSIANVSADTISYVESHGTGTPVGDPIEIAALTQAFREHTDRVGYCGIGSVKTNIGHTDTAAGVASFMKVALAMQHGVLPPSLHFSAPNPACEFERSPFYVNAALQPWNTNGTPRRAGVTSLGVGGTNAHIILEQAPTGRTSGPSRRHQVLLLSARTPAALDANTEALAAHFQARPDLNLADAAYTLRVGRQGMSQRRVVVATDAADAAAALQARDPQRVFTHVAPDEPRSVAFLFAGGGAQYPGMGADLYRDEPVFRDAVDRCLGLLSAREALDLKPLLLPAPGEEPAAAQALERPSLALPALFTIQYAQALLWRSWGVEPAAMIGHSMGEYTAAHLAGVFSLEDTLALVSLRGRLFETLPPGGMLSVPLSQEELTPLLGAELSIAAVNGPKLTVASGPVHAIDALQRELEAREVDAVRVRISVAAHSSMLEPILQPFRDFFQRVVMKAPTLPFVSNLSGTWITTAEATDPAYWVRHLRHTVRFADGLQDLLKDDKRVLLEVGPGRTLASLARQHPGRPPQQPVLNSLRHVDEQVSDVAFVLGVLGRLWANGVAVDWARFQGDEQRLRVSLPTYRFERQRHWIEPGKSAALEPEEASLDRHADLADWFYQPVWRRAGAPADIPQTGRALVFEAGQGVAQRLVQRLRAEGCDVCTVRPGSSYSHDGRDTFTVNPQAPADYDALITTLAGQGRLPQQIYHLWCVTGQRDREDAIQAARDTQRLGFFSLLSLAQALGREDADEPISLGIVTDHMQRVSTETGLVPAKATVLGACKVIPREFAHIRCRSIDVLQPPAGSRQEERLVLDLIAEVGGTAQDDVIAYRASERWVQDFEPNRLERAAGQRPVFRSKGVYLITGGLGGVGLALAGHLAAVAQARLVLVGRSGLPARDAWQGWLDSHDAQDATSRRIRQVMALEARGSEVLVAAADVTNLKQMRDVVQQAKARFGAIHGVLHTAGVLDDGVILLKDAGAAAAVLAPKVQGTLVLEAALGDAPLDFLVLFSSISAFAGLAGQVDYAAANAFLDAYAQDRYTRDGTYTVAIDWSQWAEVGMAADLAQRLGIGPADAATLQADDASAGEPAGTLVGHPLVARCVKDAADERVYATRFGVDTHWLLDEHRVLGGDALIPGTGYLELVRAASAHHRRPGTLELRDVTFLAPFAVHGHEVRELRIHLKDPGAAVSPFTIRSQAQADGAWIENVRGAVGQVDVPAATHEPAADIAERCRVREQVFTGTEKPVHLAFGPRWSNVRHIDFGLDEALVSLELPADFVGDLAQFELHPALMDMATAGAQALIPGFDESKDFFVPASYGSVRVFAPLRSRVNSHIRYRREEAAGGDLAVFDVTVLDEDDRVLVDIASFTMLRVRDKALLARTGADVPAGPTAAADTTPHATTAKPRAVANQVLALGTREGILTAEGAQVLERVLARAAGPQVVVSPQDLKGWLAQLRVPAQRPAGTAAGAEASGEGDTPGWVAPETATEKLIAEMWGEMLGVERVSATADFFELGGHSLLAVQVINKLKRRTGKALPLTALLEAPTVETLAALIEPRAPREATAAVPTAATAAPGSQAEHPALASPGTATPVAAAPATSGSGAGVAATPVMSTNRTLIRIRPGGERMPIFFVHDGNGETLLYRTLAYLLKPGHAVYGLQPAMRGETTFVHTRIVDMAAAHIQQIRTVQPQGPYLLAGLCAGGVIAFEMARQLQKAGERTLYVGIMDAAAVGAAERPLRTTKSRLNRFLGTLNQDPNASTWSRIGKAIPQMIRKTRNFAWYEAQSRLERFRNTRKLKALRDQAEQAPAEDSVTEDDGQLSALALSFLKMYEIAHREHVDHGVFEGGDVVLYRATQGDGSSADEPFKDIYTEPLMGWDRRVRGDVLSVDVPGGHSSLLQQPHVATVAGLMQAHIELALEKAGTPPPGGAGADARQAGAPGGARVTADMA